MHVLLECEIKEGDKTIASTSEIQLRSVFEEAWGEISHRLKYSPIKIARAGSTNPLSDDEQLSTSWLHLDALKSLTDGCAQYADLINRQIQAITAGRAECSPMPLDPADRSAQLFGHLGHKVHQAAKRAYRQRSNAVDMNEPAARAAAFRKAVDLFQAATEFFPEHRDENDERLLDLLREQLAYCGMYSDNEELTSRSEKIYRELTTKRPERASVRLRLGQLRRDAGDLLEAQKLMEEGLEVAASNPNPDQEVQRQANWLLRRDLAYILWRRVDLEHRFQARLTSCGERLIFRKKPYNTSKRIFSSSIRGKISCIISLTI